MQIDIAAARKSERIKNVRRQKQVDELFEEERKTAFKNERRRILKNEDSKTELAQSSINLAMFSKLMGNNSKGLIKSNFTAKQAKSSMNFKPPIPAMEPEMRELETEIKKPI